MGMVGWYGQRDDAEALATLHRALDLGINHLDTAAVYQDGANERFVGAAIRRRRAEVFLATKCGLERTPEGRIAADNRAATIRTSCDESLQRLGVEQIDLFYLHRIDPRVPIEDSMGVMAELVQAGKIRFAGISEASPDTLRRAHRIHPVAALQSELSPWTRNACRPALETCKELGVAFVAYSPLGRGFLTGAISSVADIPDGDTRRMFPRFQAENLQHNRAAAEGLQELARGIGCTPAQLALAWLLRKAPHIIPIPGTTSVQHLQEDLGASEVQLSLDVLAALDAAINQHTVTGPRYNAQASGEVDTETY